MSGEPLVMVVEDNVELALSAAEILQSEGLRVRCVAPDGVERDIAVYNPKVVVAVLDGSSAERCVRHLRARTPAPIVVVADGEEGHDAAAALDIGADDFVSLHRDRSDHPTRRELVARVRVALRRAERIAERRRGVLVSGALALELDTRRCTLHGRPVPLTDKEYDLLNMLVHNVGMVLPHRLLLERVWGTAYVERISYLRTYVSRLRKKLDLPGQARSRFEAVGGGYRLLDPLRVQPSAGEGEAP